MFEHLSLLNFFEFNTNSEFLFLCKNIKLKTSVSNNYGTGKKLTITNSGTPKCCSVQLFLSCSKLRPFK